MRCIKCGTHNRMNRYNQNYINCIRCGHSFVFTPKRYDRYKITDQLFANAIAQISANNTLYFTAEQLAYFIARKLVSDFKPRITEYQKFNINQLNFIDCLFISYRLFFIYSILNVIIKLIIAINISGFVVFDRKLIGFLLISLVASTINLDSASKSSKLDKNRSQRLLSNPNSKNRLIKDALVIIAGVIFSQFLYFAHDTSYFLLVIAAILLGRYISIVAIYLSDIRAGNRAVKIITKQIYNPGLNERIMVKSSIEKWERNNGVIAKLLRPDTSQKDIPFARENADITAYSFDRLVVCDNDIIAKFLIANNFHFERNCAILSIDGYPQNIFEITMQMLRRNPDLQVYALHDCSPQGVSLVSQLRTDARWFKDSNVTIVDVGILPRQVFNARKIWMTISEKSALQAKNLPIEIQQSLNTEELKWLMDGNFVELESFSPQKLVEILNHCMATNQNLAIDEENLIIANEMTNIDFYAVESFG